MPDREEMIEQAEARKNEIIREAQDRCTLMMRSEAYGPDGEGDGELSWGSSDSDSGLQGTTGNDCNLITGDREYVIRGDHKIYRNGDITVNHQGNINYTQHGDLDVGRFGSEKITLMGDRTETHVGSLTASRTSTATHLHGSSVTHTYLGTLTEAHASSRNIMEPNTFEVFGQVFKAETQSKGVVGMKIEGTGIALETKGVVGELRPIGNAIGNIRNRLEALQNDGKGLDGELAPVEPEAKNELCAGVKLAGNSFSL